MSNKPVKFTRYCVTHADVVKWEHFPRYWPFVRGIHRLPVNSPHKGQWRVALIFPLICAWMNGWVNNREAGDLRHHCAHYDVTVMLSGFQSSRWAVCCCLFYDFDVIMLLNRIDNRQPNTHSVTSHLRRCRKKSARWLVHEKNEEWDDLWYNQL